MKTALCIQAADLSVHLSLGQKQASAYPLPVMLWSLPVTLQDRASCETDTNLIQLLPYMTLARGSEFFMYSRGGAGAESRLHGKLSIGLGGHVEEAPAEGEALPSLLLREAAREYAEETGHPLRYTPQFTHLLYDPLSEVGRVHLGIHCILPWSGDDMIEEENQVESGQWVTLETLLSPAIFERLEPWSRVVANLLLK